MQRTRSHSRPRGPRRFGPRKRRVCRVCEHQIELSYKRPNDLKAFVNRLGKILPRRSTRLCAKHQRAMALEVRRARHMALMPFVMEPESTQDGRGGGGRRGGGRRR